MLSTVYQHARQTLSFAESLGVSNDTAELGEYVKLVMLSEVHQNVEQNVDFCWKYGWASDTAEFEELD